MHRGFFLTFEGGDGTGKTTQLERLATALREAGWSVVATREPGGTPLGQALRQWLLDHPFSLSPRTELLLYLAARAQHVESLIRPALEAGHIVLCSRFSDSTLAYQGGGLGLEEGWIRRLDAFATGGLRPDLTILLDLPPEEGLRRIAARESLDRVESRRLEFHRRVRATFLRLAQEEPERFLVLDATQPAEVLHRLIWQGVVPRLEQRGLKPQGTRSEG